MSWPGGGGPDYEVIHPVTGMPCEIPPGGWRYSTKAKMLEMIAKGRVLFRDDHTEPPIRKTYLVSSSEDDEEESSDDDAGIQVAGSCFYRSALQASNLMDEMFGAKVFDSPKDHEVIARWMNYVGVVEEDIVADFYSGSATTAHAAFYQNLTDGINRRWILAQLPEVIDPDRLTGTRAKQTAKNAVAVLSKLGLPPTIAEIGKERIRRAGKKILAEWQAKQAKEQSAERDLLNPQSEIRIPQSPDIGFRVLKIADSNFREIERTPEELDQKELALHTEHIKPDRTPEDLLFQVLVDWGVDLALPIVSETLHGKRVFFVDENALAACFDTGLSDELVHAIATRKPLRAVFRDDGFGDDSTRINVEQIFKLLSPGTEVKAL